MKNHPDSIPCPFFFIPVKTKRKPAPRAKVSRAKLVARMNELGCTGSPEGGVDAPSGKIFAATDLHYLVGADSPHDREGILEDMADGLAVCPDPTCDICNEETEV